MELDKIRNRYKDEIGLPITCIDSLEVGFRGKYVEWVEKQLLSYNVIQQHELLICFLKYLMIRDIANTKEGNVEVRVDLFMKNI